MDKNKVINEVVQEMKHHVRCKEPKQRQAKVFRALANNVINLCLKYSDQKNFDNRKILLENIQKEAFEAGFVSGGNYGKKKAINCFRNQPIHIRALLVLMPIKFDIQKINGINEK